MSIKKESHARLDVGSWVVEKTRPLKGTFDVFRVARLRTGIIVYAAQIPGDYYPSVEWICDVLVAHSVSD